MKVIQINGIIEKLSKYIYKYYLQNFVRELPWKEIDVEFFSN